jgi:hypothetical protein
MYIRNLLHHPVPTPKLEQKQEQQIHSRSIRFKPTG